MLPPQSLTLAASTYFTRGYTNIASLYKIIFIYVYTNTSTNIREASNKKSMGIAQIAMRSLPALKRPLWFTFFGHFLKFFYGSKKVSQAIRGKGLDPLPKPAMPR